MDIIKKIDFKEENKGHVMLKKVHDELLGYNKVNLISLKDSKKYYNKDIIQSYIITAAKYDFSVYEKRILYRVVDCLQYLLEGKKLDSEFSITKDLYGDVDIVLPLSSILREKDEHYSRIKKALISLLDKKIIIENNEKEWEAFSFVERPKIKERGIIRFRLHPIIYEALLDFSKGYRKYELETAMTFRSVYSMRFYELLSGQTSSLTYSIEDLKSMFQLEHKYKNIKLFVFYVIESAKKELDLKAPFSFNYQLNYEKNRINSNGGRKKIVGITFKPIYHLKNRDKILSYKDKCKNFDLKEVLIPYEIEAFISLGFTENELKIKYYDLLKNINLVRKQGKVIITSIILKYAQAAKNSKAYIIKVLRKEIKQWKEGLLANKSSHMIYFGNKEFSAYRKDKESVYSFLKNHLGLSGNELNIGMIYVMEEGGGEYFNQILHFTDGDNVKIKQHIMCGINKILSRSKFESKLLKIKKLDNLKSSIPSHMIVSKLEDPFIVKNISMLNYQNKINFEIKSDTKLIQKRLKKGWKKLVIKKISLKEKILYFLKFGSNSYLKKKANDMDLPIYCVSK